MKILLISYFIAPLQRIGSVRWTKISKYLKRKYNVEIDVLTIEKDYDLNNALYTIDKKDPLLEKDMWCFENYTVLKYGCFASMYRYFYYVLRKKLKDSKPTAPIKASVQNIESGTNKRTFIGMLKNNAQRCLQNGKDNIEAISAQKVCSQYLRKHSIRYDVVISTYSPIWTHVVAQKAKQRNPSIKWIADFRDAYAVDLLKPTEFEKKKAFCENHFYEADCVTKVLDEMELYIPKNVRQETIPNGYDPEEAASPVKPSRFSFVYTGSLYGCKRDLTPLFEAIHELADEGRIDLNDVSVDYAGVNGRAIMEMAAPYRLQHLVCDHGTIKRTDALELQRSCAVLLLSDWNTKLNKPCWSGKAYEYMMAKKPIICIMSGDVPDSMPSKYISKIGGICYENARKEESKKELKQFIEDQYTHWKKTGDILYICDKSYIEQYSYEIIADRVWDLIHQIMNQ